MSLIGPKPGDITKIHAEINQINNQRFLLTTAAITVFGVMITIIMSKPLPTSGSNLDPFVFIGSVLLLSVLMVLYIYNYILQRIVKVYTTYLIVTGVSSFEQDWRFFRLDRGRNFSSIYIRTYSSVFLLLGMITLIYPFLVSLVYGLYMGISLGLVFHLSFAFLYFLVIGLVCICKRFSNHEETFLENWERLKRKMP